MKTSTHISVLKKTLRAQGLTYKSLAQKLRLSEPTVKRLFSHQDISLKRLLEICSILNLPPQELFSMGDAKEEIGVHTYTLEQEEYFSKNPSYLAFFEILLHEADLKKIKNKHSLSWLKIRKAVAVLEKLKLIELYPGDKIKFLIPQQVRWRKNGPLAKKLLPLAKQEFLSSSFGSNLELKKFITIRLSDSSIRRFQVQIDQLVKEVEKLSKIESATGVELIDVGFLSAIRPWQFTALHDLSGLA